MKSLAASAEPYLADTHSSIRHHNSLRSVIVLSPSPVVGTDTKGVAAAADSVAAKRLLSLTTESLYSQPPSLHFEPSSISVGSFMFR